MGKMKMNPSVLKRVLYTVKNFKILILLSLIFTVASVGLSLYIPILAGYAIDAIELDKSIYSIDFSSVISNLVQIVICAVIAGILQWIISIINNNTDD